MEDDFKVVVGIRYQSIIKPQKSATH